MLRDPSEEEVATFVAALRRRMGLAHAADAALVAGIGALLIATAGAIGGLTHTSDGRSALAWISAACGCVLGALHWRSQRRRWTAAWAATLAERRIPSLHNALFTAVEINQHRDRVSDRIRRRVNAFAARALAQSSVAAVLPARPVIARASGAALAGTLAVIVAVTPGSWPGSASTRSRSGTASPSNDAGRTSISAIDVAVTAPAYARGRTHTSRDPERIDALVGSAVSLRVTTNAGSTAIEYAGASVDAVRSAQGTADATLRLDRSGVLSIVARDAAGTAVARRLIPVVAKPDAPPRVTIEHPRSDLVLARADERVRLAVRASDDLELQALSLAYTKVTGSGEQFDFLEGELPLTVTREHADRWRGESDDALHSLNLRQGDLLIVYARARDRRPGAEPVTSDSYVIEIGKPQLALAGGFAVPADEDRTAISLSALIQKTERLHAQRGALAQAAFVEQASMLAIEQRMVRTETLFLMGAHGEVEDEEAEAEHSNEIQEGRLENRGQADLRTATRLMSTAERSLLLADPGGALPSQRAALAAMQRALSRQRYFLRTLSVRSQIDPARRLTGDLSAATSWARQHRPNTPDERLAAIRSVLRDLTRLTPGDADAMAILAGRVLALDPESARLQEAARDLTGLVALPATNAEARRQTLAKVARALEEAASGAPATPAPPPALTTTPLRGAHAEALRVPGDAR